jgi:hypothetical protein
MATEQNIVWESNSTSPSQNNKSSSESKDICRIYVDPSIKSKIKLDDIYISQSSDSYGSHKDTVGISYPVICINNHVIKEEEIESMEISCIGLLPKIFLEVTTINDDLLYKDPPKDGDIISVFIRTTTDVIVPLRCDFIITHNNTMSSVITAMPLSNKMILTGDLFIPGLYSQLTSYAAIGTSKDLFKNIAKKLNIGFATNDMDEPNDKQLWISPKDSMRNFINKIINHAWENEQSFFKTWIDIYYNLNYINVNKTLMSADEIDTTALSTIYDTQKLNPIDTDQSNAAEAPKVFTNLNDNLKKSPFYVISWLPYNQSTKITEEIGSQINSHEFFHNQNLFNTEDDPYVSLMNTQMYDPNKIDSYMILRGRTTYDANTANINDMAHENIKSDDINTHSKWCGIQYVMSEDDNTESNNNTWSGNVHKNYNRAELHNLLNNKELDKMYITITVAGACLQVMRGEKMPVLLNYTPGIANNAINNSTNINKLYSGTYFVDGYRILYRYTKSSAGFSGFTTEFILKRREWPAPVDIQKE